MLRRVLRSRSGTGCSQDHSSSSSTSGPSRLPPLSRRRVQLRRQLRTAGVQPSHIVCGAGLAHSGEEQASSSALSAFLTVPTTGMGKGLGSTGGATLEKSKLDLSRKVQTFQPKTDDAGGGGDIGKIIFNGGGGGGDDDDDDDDYYDDGEDGDGDGDDGFFRKVLPQLYDRVTISAVLEEWFRSFTDLPIILRRAVEMGLFSSAQLVRFCSMDVRPGLFRHVSRTLPVPMSRSFVGRLMADPAFAQKLILENILAVGASLAYELQARGEHFSEELDFVAINTLGLAATSSAVFWMLSPSRSFGTVKKFPWQSMLGTLPNNIFDTSGPLRNYTRQSRLTSLFTKFAELSAVGALVGASTSFLSGRLQSYRQREDPSFKPSVPVPGVEQSMLGMSAFVGIHAHLRYQAVGGIDRYLFDHSSFLWSYLMASGMFRFANVSIGEMSRPWFQGLPVRSRACPQRKIPRAGLETRCVPKVTAQPTTAKSKKKAKGFELSVVSAST